MPTYVLRLHNVLKTILGVKTAQAPLKNELGEYENDAVQKTLDNSYVPAPILEARRVQDRIIRERFEGKKYNFADIGCGDGYHGEIFAQEGNEYHGFEISSEMVQKTRQRWLDSGLSNAKVTECDAGKIKLQKDFYDVAWSLYFTPGNFREEFDDISKYDDAYLDKNPAFIGIVKNFYEALRKGGKLFLTVYKDLPETEDAQRTFYKKTGQKVITSLGSRFVATEENFWSVRWTEKSMLSNLAECGIEAEQVKFNDLSSVAWLVEVTK